MNGDWIPPPPPPPDREPGVAAPPTWRRGHRVDLEPRSVFDLMDATYNLYRQHWGSLLGVVALLIVPVQFVNEYLTRNYRHTVFGVRAGEAQAGRLAVIGLVITALTLLVVHPLLIGGISRAVARFHLGEEPSGGDVLEFGLAILPSVALVVVLYSIVVFGGALLLLIPGLVFVFRFLFAPSAAAIEGHRGREALRRSWGLTAHSFWRVVGIVLLFGLLTGIAGGIISLPADAAADSMGTSGWFLRAVGGSVGTVLTTPFTLIAQVLLYLDLRVRKEGLNLDRLSVGVTGRWPAF